MLKCSQRTWMFFMIDVDANNVPPPRYLSSTSLSFAPLVLMADCPADTYPLTVTVVFVIAVRRAHLTTKIFLQGRRPLERTVQLWWWGSLKERLQTQSQPRMDTRPSLQWRLIKTEESSGAGRLTEVNVPFGLRRGRDVALSWAGWACLGTPYTLLLNRISKLGRQDCASSLMAVCGRMVQTLTRIC